MMGDNTRQYQVNYAITVSDQASGALTKLGEAAQNLAAPMGEAVRAIEMVQKALIQVREQVGTSLTITPALNTATLQTSLTELETMCSASAKKIATMMGNAMMGIGSQSAITVPTTKKEIEEQIKKNEEQMLVAGKRAKKALERQNEELKKMKAAGNKKGVVSPVEALRSYTAIASKAENLGKVGKAIEQINKNMNLYGTKSQKTITVDADISPAISKINSLLDTIRKSTAALPITVAKSGKAAVEGTKGGKYIDKNGNLTKTGKNNIEAIGKAKVTPVKKTITDALAQANQAVTNWQKTADRRTITISGFFNGYDATLGLEIALKHLQELASKRPVSIRSTFNGGDAGFQLNMSLKHLQELASKRPVSIRSTFNGGDAGFQLNMSLKHLQELAAKNPIVIHAVLSQDGLMANKGTASSNIIKTNNNAAVSENAITNAVASEKVVTNAATNVIANTSNSSAKVASETEKVVAPFRYPSQPQTNATERHLESMSKMRIERMAAEAKFERNMARKLHAERQRMYDELFGRDALHREWIARDKAGKSTRAKNIAAREAREQARLDAVKQAQEARKRAHQLWTSNDKMGLSTRAKNIAAREAREQARLDAVKQAQEARKMAHKMWKWRDERGESTRAKNIASREIAKARKEAAEIRMANKAAQHNARQLERLRAMQPSVPPMSPSGGSNNKYGGNAMPRIVKSTEGLYQRARTFWYPFTGNTSFGARSPMAVDMAKGMGTMFAIGGAMSAIGSSLHQSVAYQNTMKTTQAILQNGTKDYSDKSFKAMENTVRQVGKETKFTAPQVASAAKFLAMAGYNTSDIKSAINPVANIALIGDTNLGETADKLTNVMTTFGIQPEKMNDIADIMTSTFTRSNTDMMMLAESAKYAGGIANLYGGKFKNNFSDVMAMFGILGNAGIQASSAGTTLRMMYQNLMQPNKNQLATLQQYGIFTRDASGAPLEMVNILKQIYEKVPKDKLADAVGNMFRITAQPGASTLAQAIGSGKLMELMEANRNAAGSGIAQTIADEKKNTVAGLWAQVESTFTEGILQAFENREGGWAGMLIKLRDYLAKPETVQMLSSLVDLVENLAGVIGQFAKIYAKVYSMFPNLINSWMYVQLLFTQLGYLATPVIQLMSVLNRFSDGILSVTAATTAATVAENGRKAAIVGNAATGALSAAGSAGAAAGASKVANGLVAANIAAGMATYTGRKPFNNVLKGPYPNITGYTPRPDILGPLSLTRPRYFYDPAVTKRMKLYERSRGYMQGGMTKKQRRQLNGTTNRMLADLRTKEKGLYVPSVLPLGFGFGTKPIYGHGRELVDITYKRGGATQVLPFNQYSSGVGAVLHGAEAQADRAAIYRRRSQQWGAIAGYQSLPYQKRAMAAANADKYLEMAIAADILQRKKAAAAASSVVGAPAAIHKFSNWKVLGRASRMSWNNSFSAGRAIGALNLATIGKSLIGMATKFVGVFAKFIGMLTSPIGLIITAIAGIATAIYFVWKKFKTKAENLKLADESSKWKETANISIKKAYIQAGIDAGGGFKPVEIGYSKSEEGSEGKTYKISSPVADILADADKTEGLDGRQIVDKYVKGFDALPQSYINSFIASEKYGRLEINGVNDGALANTALGNSPGVAITSYEMGKGFSIEDARKLGMVALWAEEASKQTDLIQAMKDIQGAIKNKDMAKAQSILEAYKPTSKVNMLDMANAEDIRNIGNPTKFREWQEVQFKILNDLVQKYQSPLLQHEKAMGMIEQYQKLGKKEKEGYDATALVQTLIQSIPVIFNGSLTSIGLDKMGRINWSELAKSVNDNIPLSVAQQQSILQSMYTAIYNDPNIKNCTSIINLLKTYLPVIANESNPYEEGGKLSSMWDTPEEDKGGRGPLKPKTPATPGYLISQLSNINIPKWQTDFDRASNKNKGVVENTIAFNEKRTGQPTATNGKMNIKDVKNGTNSTNNAGKNQKDYANKYDRNASRPTQVIINIGNLANFDKTTIAKNADDRAITNAIETKITEAVSMLSAQILTTASSTISQGLS